MMKMKQGKIFRSHELPTAIANPHDEASLVSRWGVPPFSVLDARRGYWRTAKNKWLDLGIESELGRNSVLTYHVNPDGTAPGGGQTGSKTGTSIFDPFLTELIYDWFCPPGGRILDPFAGGSVRGIVAAVMGFRYAGIDLSDPQIDANRDQARRICPDRQPTWLVGDSANVKKLTSGTFDLLFTCPPYHDLEVYSNDPRDLSNMSWAKFKDRYQSIISDCADLLNNDRFAVFVVSQIRDKRTGHIKDLVGLTVEAFRCAGLALYNDMVFLTPLGSAPIRSDKQFLISRKACRTHQNVIVFVKGCPKKAVRAIDVEESNDD